AAADPLAGAVNSRYRTRLQIAGVGLVFAGSRDAAGNRLRSRGGLGRGATPALPHASAPPRGPGWRYTDNAVAPNVHGRGLRVTSPARLERVPRVRLSGVAQHESLPGDPG